MAGQMTHMLIAYKLAERMDIDEGKEEFILGSIAPDSVPFTEPLREEKIHSHLFENCGPWGDTQDYDMWLTNIKAFHDKYVPSEKDTRKKLFLLGICVHCLTDYWNDLMVWRDCQRKMIPPMTYQGFKDAYYPEAQRLDRWLYQNTDSAREIMELLKASTEYDFEDYVTAKDLVDIKNYMLGTQYDLKEKVDVSGHKYYPAEKLLDLVEKATEKIDEQLKEYA